MTPERKKSPPSPGALLARLNASHCLPPGRLSGLSLKYIRSGRPVLVFRTSPEERRALESHWARRGAGAVGAPTIRTISTRADQLVLGVRVSESTEETRLLIRTPAVLPHEPPAVSTDALEYDRDAGRWRGRPEILEDLKKETLRLTSERDLTTADCLHVAVLASRLDFTPHEDLLARCRKCFSETHAVKMEQRELKKQFAKLVTGARPSRGFQALDAMGALQWFLPELAAGKGLAQNRYHKYDIYHHSMYACDAVRGPQLVLRLAALFHDLGKVDTRRERPNGESTFHNHEVFSAHHSDRILRRFGFSPGLVKRVRFLVRGHMFHYTEKWTDKAVRRFMRKVRPRVLQDLITLRLADREGSGKRTALPRAIQDMMAHMEKIRASESELKLGDLAIGGHDLLAMGMEPGPAMGNLLHELLDGVRRKEFANETDALRQAVEKWMDSRQGFAEEMVDESDLNNDASPGARVGEVLSHHE